MEWTADELERLLSDCGFPERFLLGYTLNNNVELSMSTILAIAGREATFRQPEHLKSVAAVINVFNESDILEQVVRYLKDQSVKVHIVDNWSTDGSYEIATAAWPGSLFEVIGFPAAPPADYDWMGALRHSALRRAGEAVTGKKRSQELDSPPAVLTVLAYPWQINPEAELFEEIPHARAPPVELPPRSLPRAETAGRDKPASESNRTTKTGEFYFGTNGENSALIAPPGDRPVAATIRWRNGGWGYPVVESRLWPRCHSG